MQKVYLILRNNQQTGPYSFEELLQFQLKPQDLIWVEGKSYGWRYPAEIETLKPYLPATVETAPKEVAANQPEEKLTPASFPDQPSPKKVFVSMPVNSNRQPEQKLPIIDPLEQKAEELRKRAQAFTPAAEAIKTNYNRDLHEAEEDYTQWVYQKKTKKKTLFHPKQLALAAALVLLAVGSWWSVSKFKQSSPEPLITSPKTVEPLKASVESNPSDSNYLPEKNIPSSSSISTGKKDKIKKLDKTKNEIKTPELSLENKETAINQSEVIQEPSSENSISEEKQKEVIADAPVEKKKTFKEKIGELFKRKKTDEPVAEQDAPSVDNGTNERKANRRGEENETTPVMTDVSDQVEIKTNKIGDSWMMGVKGLKLTLYNRSNVTISSAKVEVLYYSDNEDLLEKKILSFSNILPKKSQTLAAPDQRMADHIEYKVLSATGIEGAYANR